MTISELERALFELADLMATQARESAYQAWFENHGEIFNLLGYRRVIPHPQVWRDGDQRHVPDFMGERAPGVWEIIEIKRPDTQFLEKRTRRALFLREFDRYVTQCADYIEAFEDSVTRDRFASRYGTTIQRKVPAVLIAGSSDLRSDARVNDRVRRTDLLEFQTYDALFHRLEMIRRTLLGYDEGTPGLGFHTAIRCPNALGPGRTWLLDIGRDPQRARITCTASAGEVRIEVIDDTGRAHVLALPIDLAVGVPHYLGFELGRSASAAVARLWVDDAAETGRWGPFAVSAIEPFPFVVGNSMQADAPGEPIHLSMLGVFGRILPFEERLNMRRHIASKVSDITWTEFRDGRFLHNRGHPRFPGKKIVYRGLPLAVVEPASTDLVQYEFDRMPLFLGELSERHPG